MSSVSDKPNIDVPTFVEALRRSGLLNLEDLKRSLRSVAITTDEATRTAKDVAEHLVAAEQITAWQAGQLLRGKYRGFRIGSYLLRKPIGKGGMGVVFAGQHVVLGTHVAIKFLPKSKSSSDKSVSRFLAEARAAAKLVHPNIVRVHDCNIEGKRLFMVMDLVDGPDLGNIVRKKGPLSYFAAIMFLEQAAAGLGHAHEAGITHRDVKPSNFLVDKNGTLKVADLGLALFEIDSPDRYTQDGGAVLGTVDYLAPEQAWDSTKVDRRADIYALGCTLYYMLTGKPPFDSGTMAQRLAQHQTATPAPVSQFRPDCPPVIWNLCLKMLAKRPQHRVQKMSEVVGICQQILPTLNGSGNLSTITDGVSPLSKPDSSTSFDGGVLVAADSSELSTLAPSGAAVGAVDFGSFSMEASPSNTPLALPDSDSGWSQPGDTAPGAYAVPGAYAAPAARRPASTGDSKALYAKVGIALGLTLAFAAIGISLYSAIFSSGSEKGIAAPIKSYEQDDGSTVIIVEQ